MTVLEIEATLRSSIRRSAYTLAVVAERADVSRSALYRFMNHANKCSLSLGNLVALAGVVGLELSLDEVDSKRD